MSPLSQDAFFGFKAAAKENSTKGLMMAANDMFGNAIFFFVFTKGVSGN